MHFIRTRGLNHRQFVSVLQCWKAEHPDIPYHSYSMAELKYIHHETVGRSRRKFWDVKDKSLMSQKLKNENWKTHMAFLVDVLEHLNNINVILHRRDPPCTRVRYGGASFQQRTNFVFKTR